MFTVSALTQFDDPRLAPFRTLRAQVDHLNQGVFVGESEKVLRRLLESSFEVISVLLPPHRQADFEPLLAARPENVALFVADKELLHRLTGFSLFQGIVGLARVPPARSFSDLAGLPAPQILAAVDGLTNAENVGAVARNVVALGGQALIVGETSAHPYLRRAVRSSMGTIFKLPYYLSSGLAQTLTQLRAAGIRCVAAHPHPGSKELWRVNFAGPTCLVFGAEGEGLRPEVLAACDETVAIPMAAKVDSLNVANAVAVFFAEALRQRIGWVNSRTPFEGHRSKANQPEDWSQSWANRWKTDFGAKT